MKLHRCCFRYLRWLTIERARTKSLNQLGGKSTDCMHIEIFRNYCATGIAICIVVIYCCLLQNDNKKAKKRKTNKG